MSQTRLIGLALALAVSAGLLVTWLLYPAPILPGSAELPALRGTPASQAVADLAALGLRGRLESEIADPLIPKGAVSWQSPAALTVLPESAVVRLGISSGPPTVLVPDLIDYDLETAATVLEAAGLSVGRVDSSRSREPAGTIVRTRPEARTARKAGEVVELTISKGQSGGTE